MLQFYRLRFILWRMIKIRQCPHYSDHIVHNLFTKAMKSKFIHLFVYKNFTQDDRLLAVQNTRPVGATCRHLSENKTDLNQGQP